MSNFRIVIADVPSKENLVAEIFYKEEQWIEISQETDELLIRFYSPNEGNYWEFSCDEAIQVLEQAKKKLLSVG